MKYLLKWISIMLFVACTSPTEREPVILPVGGIISIENQMGCSIEIVVDNTYKRDIVSSCIDTFRVKYDGNHSLLIRTIPAGWEDFMVFKLVNGNTIKFAINSGIIMINN